MAELNVQQASRAGVALTALAMSASDTFVNNGQTVLIIANGHSVDCTVTAVVTRTVDGQAVPGRSITVPDGATDMAFGPFPINDYGSAVTITTSHQTLMTARLLTIL